MNAFLPTKRRTSTSKKTFSTSFLRMTYGSIFALLLLMSGGVQAQILTFEFAGIAGNETSVSSSSNNANITSSTISRGAGLTAAANGDRFNATSWAITSIANAVSGNDYMQFTITPNSGYQFNVTSMVIQIQRSTTGFTKIALRSSVDGYASNLDAEKSVVDNTSTQTFTFTFTQANSSSAVTYRLYGYAESNTGTGGPGDGTGNDIVVNGAVSATCSAPTVTLQGTPVTSIATTSATLNGNVTAQGDFAINTRGFEYSVNSNMTASATTSTATTATGTYSENATGLVANTEYYYRGFAVNDCTPNKTGYTATSSYPTFITLHNAPTIGTGSGATPSSFTANWTAPTGGAASFTYEIQVDDDNTFASVDFTTSGLAVTSVSATGLSSATTYYYRVRAVNAGGNSAWSSVSAGIATLAPAPEINIKQGVTIIESAGTFAHGNQITTTSGSAVTFTIENTGEAALSVGALSKSGTDAGQFTITQPVSSSVAASGTTTFTVVFSPTSLGAKTAQLSLVNNDGDENPYTINLTGTGTASAASDIVTDATFVYNTNIDYKNYITADITAGNSVELGRFTLRDGGATTDADNLGTIMSALSLTVGNSANLQRLAIYDGATEVAEVAAAGTTNFTGLTLTAVDNGTKTFTIRGSFNTAVTDNQRIQLTVASATASAAGSGFGTISATTSTTGSNNVIAVTADRLTFTTQPTTTAINVAMATVVVSATDINSNVDLDKTGSVAITSTGTLTGSPVTVALSSGAASFTTLTHTVAATGRTLSATLTGLTSATSSTFDITEIVYVNGDYKTITGTSLLWSSSAHWQKYNGSSWNAAGADGTPASTRDVYINGSMSTNGSRTANRIIVNDGAVLTVNASSTSTTKTLIKEGGTITLNAVLKNSGGIEIEDNGNLVINYVANNNSTIWDGTENFHPASNVVIKEWDVNGTAANRPLLNNVKINATTYNGYSAVFGNLKIDLSSSGEAAGSFILLAGNISLNVAHGNLELINPHPTNNINIKGTGGLTTSGIGGNFIVDDGYAPTKKVVFSTSGTLNFTIKGNMQLDGSTTNITTATSATAFDIIVNGNLNITSGAALDFVGSSTSSPAINFDLKGNLNGIGSGLLRGNSSGANFNFNFSGTSPQTVDIESTSSTENSTLNFNIKTGSTVKLLNRNFELGQNSKLNVETGGTLDFDFAAGTPLNVLISGGQTGTVFDAQAGSTIRMTSPDGVRIVADGAFGNVQTATRTFGVANYHYVGNANQITGSALPSTVASILVKNSTATNEVTLTNAITANTKLQVEIGILNLNEKTTAGGASSTIEINAPGTLKIVGTNTYPDGFSTHTIDNDGTVHYAGTNQNIAAIPSPWMYGKLKVSGTGTKLLNTTDVQVGNTLEVTASLLSIGTGKTLTVTNAVTTINNGISIADGGSLVQITDENVNVGKIAVTRITKPMNKYDYTYWSSPVAGNTLHDLSPDTHVNRYYSYNPDAVAPALNWTAITGGAATMIAGKGYIIRAPNGYSDTSYTAYTGSFNGVPNNGTVSIGVSGSATEDKYNLLGNPYPSAISAADFVAANVGGTNDALDGTLYFWSHNSPFLSSPTFTYSTGDYASWNGSGGTATTNAGDGNSTAPDGYIAAGQGFFVKGSDDGGTAVFKNTMREKGSNMNFYRPNAAQNASNVNAATSETTTPEKHRVWLNLHGGTNGFSQALVGYIANATNGYDKLYDGKTFGGNLVTFYSINNANNLVIQGRALPFVDTDEVPMGYKSTITGNLTISIDHKDGALENQAIYIKDNVLDIVHDLTVSNYVFATVPGTFNDRFVLRYLPAEDLANPTFEEQISNVTIRKNDTTLRVNSPYETIDEVLVYDIMGRLLFDKKDCNTNTFETNTILNGEQTLIVKVRLTNGGVVTKKVL